jgi:hypothetical protein
MELLSKASMMKSLGERCMVLLHLENIMVQPHWQNGHCQTICITSDTPSSPEESYLAAAEVHNLQWPRFL